jgi:glycosyltransferase involved in cell wall biosynthesis
MKLAVLGDAGSVNVQRWVEGLVEAGGNVRVFSLRAGDVPHAAVDVVAPGLPLGKLAYVAAIPATRRLLRSFAPDVVVGYFASGYGTLARGVGMRPLVQVTAGNDVLITPRSRVLGPIVRRNLIAADLVVALERHMRDAVVAMGVRPGRVLVLPHGIPLDEFEAARPGQSRRRKHVVSTRALERFYRVDVLVDAMAALPPRHADAFATIAGDGSARPALEAHSRRIAAGRVRFVGPCTNAGVARLLRAHDTYVSTSPSDGVSASLLEAMAAGLLPIVVDNDANRQWIQNGYNGLLYAASDHEALARCMTQAFDDASLRRRAYDRNLEVVRARGDRRQNSERFLNACAALVDNDV